MKSVESIEKSGNGGNFRDVSASELSQIDGGWVIYALLGIGLAVVASQVYDRYAN